jgi:hypothetical protein
MSAQIVLDYYLEKYQTACNTLTDIEFSNLSFLKEREPIYNMKGQKVSKSYYDMNGKEAIRIEYKRVFGEHIYNSVGYANVFIGIQKTIHYLDWAGEIAYSKVKQFYEFNLEPNFEAGNLTPIGFSSQKQRQILKSERYAADDYLQAKNPDLYAMLYSAYTAQYDFYLKTGKKQRFVDALNAETNAQINSAFARVVDGFETLTVKELILMNLQ